MKKTFTLIVILALSLAAFSQTEVEVVTGAGYANEVYYNFEDGTLKSSARNAWDIAFSTAQMSVSIQANNGNNIKLYTYTKGDIDDWAAVDTTGMDWKPLFNSIVNWEYGAFNANTVAGNDFDYGWGVYSMSSHTITGDSLFIISLAGGNYKKLAIVEKAAVANQYTFKYADLDGGNEVTETFDADDYATLFAHYSIDSGRFVEQEPEASWQLLFTKYFDYTIPYIVTGVLANAGVGVQEVRGVDQTTYDDYDLELLSDTLTQIGSDWKTFNMETFQYDITDDVVYFVQDTLDGEEVHPIWKIYFTAFGGSADGKYTFIQEKFIDDISVTNQTSMSQVLLYPTSADYEVNIIHDLVGKIEVLVYNTEGKLVMGESSVGTNSLNNHRLDVTSLPLGIYRVLVRTESELHTLKFIRK